MARRRNREGEGAELIFKFLFGALLLISLAVGGLGGFAKVFTGLLTLVAMAAVLVAAGFLLYLLWRLGRARQKAHDGWASRSPFAPTPQSKALSLPARPVPPPTWSEAAISEALGDIDWYQFEKFCAALLRVDGYVVERKGGAQPDGGVDLIAEKAGEKVLIQCKHWRTWTVQERVVREMLGSMTHFNVTRGAIYTLKGWTQPAAAFAEQHGILLRDATELSKRAMARLTSEDLDEYLKPRTHHCPKCESPMIWREGNFESFWGCSRFPRCRSTLKYSGAR